MTLRIRLSALHGRLLGRFLTSIILLASTSVLGAQSDATIVAFDEGVRLFNQDDFAAALGAFQTAEASGEVSSTLLYNIGNTYFRLNQLGRATLYYERARRLDPRNEHIRHSLAVARERTEDRFSRIPDPVWTSAWQGIVSFMRPGGLFALGLLFYLFGLGLAAQRIYQGIPNDWLRRGIVIGLVAGFGLLSAGMYASYQSGLIKKAVILDTSTEVFDMQSGEGEPLVIIHEGLVVTPLQSNAEWIEIRLPNGVTGWVRDDVLETI